MSRPAYQYALPTKSEQARRRIEALLREAGHVPVPPPPPDRSCRGKTQYSARLARVVAADIRATAGENVHPYACPWCPAWHVGHPMRAPQGVPRA